MTSKHHKWQLNWSRLPDGSVRHASGLTFVIVGDPDLGQLRVDSETLDQFQDSELARGVPLHDMAARLTRLTREAGEWHIKNRM